MHFWFCTGQWWLWCHNKVSPIVGVTTISPRSHIGATEFQEVNWLPINYRVFQIIVNHMLRILNGKSPIYLQEGITKSSRIHTHIQPGLVPLHFLNLAWVLMGKKLFFSRASVYGTPSLLQCNHNNAKIFLNWKSKNTFLVNLQKLKMQCIFLINQAGPDSFVYNVFNIFLMFSCVNIYGMLVAE